MTADGVWLNGCDFSYTTPPSPFTLQFGKKKKKRHSVLLTNSSFFLLRPQNSEIVGSEAFLLYNDRGGQHFIGFACTRACNTV